MTNPDQPRDPNIDDSIDPAHLRLRNIYNETAEKYRQQDEEHISGDDYKHLSRLLHQTCMSFGRQIDVLDLGCGTGRYFHCLINVRRLIGLDISQEMLDAAKRPVKWNQVTASEIVLMQGDLFSANLPPNSFDFIYCLGVFGNGCEASREVCAKIYDCLRPGGLWFFDATDVWGMPRGFRLRKWLVSRIYTLLPRTLKQLWLNRSGWPPFFGHNTENVKATLTSQGFRIELITTRRSRLPKGDGYKLETLCRKPKPQ